MINQNENDFHKYLEFLSDLYQKDKKQEVSKELQSQQREELEGLTYHLLEKHIDVTNNLNNLLNRYIEIHDIATKDSMTGLYNYKKFMEDIEMNVKKANRTDHEFSLATMDLNNFKRVNDVHGHAEGNAAIGRLGNYIKENTRDYEKSYRQGGDEFGFILENINLKNSLKFAERLLTGITDKNNLGKYAELNCGASIGIAHYKGNSQLDEIKTANKLYVFTDEAMYFSKQSSDSDITYAHYDEIYMRENEPIPYHTTNL